MSVKPKKLKIGIVLDTTLDTADGVPQYVLAISKWLSDQGHEVHYLVGETKRTDLPNLHSLSRNITVTFNGNKVSIPLWANRKKVKRILEEHHFDVLHVQTPHHPLMAQYIIKHAPNDTAIIGTFHILPYDWWATVSTWLLGRLLKPSLKKIDRMLGVSSSAAIFEKKTFGLNAGVSPNVFEYERFAKAEPLVKYDDDKITVFYLNRLVRRKGCQYLLQAVARLDRKNLPDFRVVVGSKGEMMDELQQYVRRNGLQDVVEFTGFISEDDKPAYYASADISVFPSTSGESFGIVLLEAMASGSSAVLAGNNPGYSTVMETQQDQLFDPKNIDAFSELLKKYLLDGDLRKKQAAFGREYVKKFDIETVGPELVKIYQNAIAKRRGA